jgi:anhydro-N-acetylmuramic acid kinase
MGKMMRAVGMMSGTSMDGIDVALLETDGEAKVERRFAASYAYEDAFRAALKAGLADAASIVGRGERPGRLAALERELTQRHAQVLGAFISTHALAPSEVAVVGFHGQTVRHAPERRLTVQIGDGGALARASGIDVVYDLRAADVAAGGEGAPLAPVYHRALAANLADRPLAVVNVGGVANVTYVGRAGQLIAFDTGPGNALLDDWMFSRSGQSCDRGGRCAAAGRVEPAIVAEYLRGAFFGRRPPKSLDRDAFSTAGVAALGLEDGAATLTAFTARALARAREHFPEEPRLWIVCGGGRRNTTLMTMIAGHVEAAVAPAEAVGWDGDVVEAEAWAYLAVRALKALPITFPMTTGCPAPLSAGVLAKAR